MFNRDAPEALDESRTRKDRAIVYFHRSWKGNGDHAFAVKLAYGLKQRLDMPVELMVGRQEDFEGIKTMLNLSKDSWDGRQEFNGLQMRHVAPELIYREVRDSQLSVFTPLAVGGYEHFYGDNPMGDSKPQFDLLRAPVNFYIQEYDARTLNPHFMKEDTFYSDKEGNLHFVASTGFNPDSFGLLTEDLEGERDKQGLFASGLLESLSLKSELLGAAYPMSKERFYGNYLQHLSKSLSPGERAVVVNFAATPKCLEDLLEEGSFWADKPILQRYPLASPETGVVFDYSLRGDRQSNISVLNVGPQDQQTYLSFLRASELPVMVTGDNSLSEAISLNKVWVYDLPCFKHFTQKEMRRAMRRFLEPKDVQKLLPLTGLKANIPLELANEETTRETLTRWEGAYKEVRARMDQYVQEGWSLRKGGTWSEESLELVQRMRDLQGSYPSMDEEDIEAAVFKSFFRERLQGKGVMQPSQAVIDFVAGRPPIFYGDLFNEEGNFDRDIEDRIDGHFRNGDLSYGSGVVDTSGIFSDPEARVSLGRFNQQLRSNHNLLDKLAPLITTTLQGLGSAKK